MNDIAERLLEGLAAAWLEGLAAAGFYICFFGSHSGAVLAGAGIGFLFSAAFLQPDLQSWALLLSVGWMMFMGGVYKHKQWQELFLAGGVWLLGCNFAYLLSDFQPLQFVPALTLFGMTTLFLLRRGRLYPLWMVTLLCIWLLSGFFQGIVYEEGWQEQVMTLSCYLVLGGVFIVQQIVCIRQEMRRRAWEEKEEPREEFGKWLSGRSAEEQEKKASDGGAKNWKKAADREYRRLQIFEHDFRHHLDMLGAMYEEGNPAEARDYLEDLKQARLGGQGRIVGGERELSYILMAKKEACRKAQIAFSCQILGSPRGITQMDMTALLLNLLDNAIRACEKVPEPRSIGIMLLARGNLWQIELVNTGRYEGQGGEQERTWQEDPKQERSGQEKLKAGRAGQASRRRKEGEPVHGIGLVSVRQIVEKYQGVFEIRQEGDMVVQKVILTGRFPE